MNISRSNDPVRTYQKKGSLLFMTLVLFIVALIGMLIGFSFMIRGVVTRIQVKNGEREWLSQSLQTLANLSNDKAKAEEGIAAFRVALPLRTDILGVIFPHIQSFAHARGVVVTIQKEALIPGGEGVPDAFSFSLSAQGAPSALFDFLRDLEVDNTITSVQDVDFNEEELKSNHLTLRGMIYVQTP